MKTGISVAAALMLSAATAAQADPRMAQFEVTVTNISKGTLITPFIAATHSNALHLFELGEPASDEIAHIAEGGDTGPMQALLESSSAVYATSGTAGPLFPGNTVSFTIATPAYGLWWTEFSMAAMLVPTNDTFVSLDGVALPPWGSKTYLANAYDAGTEPNDESCVNVPGPACGGEGYSPELDGEGYVYPSPGTHGEGDLSRAMYGWSGPVAKVVIKRMQ